MYVGVVLQWAAIIFTVFVFFWTNHGTTTREKKVVMAFLAMTLALNVAYLFDLMASSPEASFLALELEYGTLIFMGYFLCLFLALHIKHHVPHWIGVYALIYDLMMLGVTWTGTYHDLLFQRIGYVMLPDGCQIAFEWGALSVFFMLGCQVVPLLLGFALLVSYFVTHGILADAKHVRQHGHGASPEQSYRARGRLLLLLYLAYVLEMLFFVPVMQASYRFAAPLGMVLADLFLIHFWGRKGFHLETAATNTAFANMQEGVLVLSNTQELLFYNAAAARVFPELSDKVLHRNLKRLRSVPLVLFEEYEKRELELGGRMYEVRRLPIFDAWSAVCGSLLLLRDQTQETAYAAQLARAQKETARAEQEVCDARAEVQRVTKSRSEFLANLSHEIRTPMNAIVGFSELIMEESRGRKVYDFACDIKNASGNLLAIINDILNLSKLENGQLEFEQEPYVTQQLIEETLHMAKLSAASKGLQLKRDVSEKLPCRLIGDCARMRQILMHFISFGIKYTERGYVKVTITHKWIAEEQIQLIFRFEDTGIGFIANELAEVFEQIRFLDEGAVHQLDSLGIGMALIKRFVELMNGTVEAASEPGKGTVFTVCIPQRVADARSIAQQPWHKENAAGKSAQPFAVPDYQVLVVDDNKINRKVACGALAPYQFCVDEAESGQQAIDLAREKSYDLILMDHMMPEMDGIEATAQIREDCGENGQKPVIIALSANAYNNAKEMFLRSGFQDFIAKPLDKQELHQMLCKWISPERRQKAGKTPEVAEKKETAEADVLLIPGVDVSRALDAHTGGVADYLELLELYYLDGTEKKELLLRLVQVEDYHNYEIEVHGLKSASANIGAFALSELAKSHEFAAKENDHAFIRADVQNLVSVYDALLQELARVLRAHGYFKEENKGAEGEPLSAAQTQQRMQEILEDVEKFRSKEAAHKTEALLSENIEKSAKECLKDVRNRLRMYDDDTAEDLLRAFLATVP